MKSSVLPPTSCRKVLLIEDEPRLRDMLLRAMVEMGFEGVAAASAEAALRHLESAGIDIVVLDLNLPGIGGMELFRILHQRWGAVQVIVLTGFGDLSAAREAIHLNVVDFLTKPCPLGDLELALERARLRRQQLTHPSPIEPEDQIPLPRAGPASDSLQDVERNHILSVLERNNGNRAATAAELGISLRTLYYRLGQYQRERRTPS